MAHNAGGLLLQGLDAAFAVFWCHTQAVRLFPSVHQGVKDSCLVDMTLHAVSRKVVCKDTHEHINAAQCALARDSRKVNLSAACVASSIFQQLFQSCILV